MIQREGDLLIPPFEGLNNPGILCILFKHGHDIIIKKLKVEKAVA
jgi:hypothetical protein